MKVYLTSISYSVPFGIQDPRELREKISIDLNNVLEASNEFKSKYADSDLLMPIVFHPDTKKLKVLGPSKEKRLVIYNIWLPIRVIKKSDNWKLEYLKFLKEGIFQILLKYNMLSKSVIACFDEVEIALSA